MVLRRIFSWSAPALLVLVSLLTGCASRPEGVLVPIGDTASPGTTKVNLVVATTRRPSDNPGILFSGERDKLVSLNEIVVSIPPEKNRKAGEVQWPKKLPPNPQKDFTTVSVTPVKTDVEMAGWVRPHLTKSRRVMVFVHGFNNTFEDSVYRFAQIVHDSGADVAPVIFTWPSRASVFDYNYDKESTNYSRDALEQILRAIVREPEVKDITVMAHSMGSWLTVEALRQMAIRDGRVNAKITDVILASPDLDVDVFSKQFLAMGKQHPRFTLFTSRDDKALALSRRISGNIDRLGQIDPSIEPYRSELERAGITVIDLTQLKAGDRLNHGKFAASPEVVQLIGKRLVAGQTITDSQVGLGDRLGAVAIGTAQGVGTAASLVVTAPIAVFDPNTRKTYDEQIDRFGRAVGNTVGAVTIPTQ
ncbi:alpha/beta hydrolase [Brucella intermedia]|uniref:Alpha/beta hydrolase n=1 Tax=Brucella intermedia GD04153 TaxID=2975438 RepID=A0AA42GXV0_9HYPH|nr:MULTISPECIES: alpha/beta hydrolase [Brucella/Ochrobactrum group]KAB2672575.1 alpha/beta hydrolase [Ochrobactrum sp. LMG 5442]HCH72789.1 alpha/beta hydrolase [Ochrobactrum sp.]KAB2696112.1 alpha/beta hydrolase [Brucella intermedia]KAB2711653.1 alpha/beta hydrolase [Brucella intermedia]KAB2719874.1 alpha/beta hydrolase [Brucella intermedia]